MFSVKIPLSKKKTSALKEQFALFDKESLTMGPLYIDGTLHWNLFSVVPCFIIVKQIRTQFFKQDGDGTISVRELGSVLKSIGLEPEPQQLQRLIDIADTDKVISLQLCIFVRSSTVLRLIRVVLEASENWLILIEGILSLISLEPRGETGMPFRFIPKPTCYPYLNKLQFVIFHSLFSLFDYHCEW